LAKAANGAKTKELDNFAPQQARIWPRLPAASRGTRGKAVGAVPQGRIGELLIETHYM